MSSQLASKKETSHRKVERFADLSRPYVILDVETTDKNIFVAKIVSVAALKVLTDGAHQIFQAYVCPDAPMTPGAQKVNGLSDDFLKQNGQPPKVALTNLKAFIEDLPLVMHNGLAFDGFLLASHFRQYCGLVATDLKNPIIDTILIAMHQKNTKSIYGSGLEKLMREIDSSYQHRHEALDDVLVLAIVHEKMSHITKGFDAQFEISDSCTLADYLMLPEHLSTRWPELQTALIEGLTIDLDYQGLDKPMSRREATPLFVQGKNSLVVHCHRRDQAIHFRFDGIQKIHRVFKRA
jgi:DNA polymerase III alpha subunit (gram-positive type)